jgi:PPP family 3-phenylpropionic acid transporter
MMSFERIRVFGSFGFIVTTFLLGFFAKSLGLQLVPVAGIIVLGSAVLASKAIAEVLRDRPLKTSSGGPDSEGAKGYVISYALICASSFVLWSSHAVSGLYFSLYLERLGWSDFEISWAWAVPVAAEVLMFYGFHWLEKAMSLELIMMISMSLGALRWFLLANFQDPAVILLAQTGHAFSFAPLYTCTVRLAHRVLPDQLRDRGQGFLVAAGIGAGNLFGNLVAGLVVSSLPSYGEVYRVFWIPFCLALVGCLCSTVLYGLSNGPVKLLSKEHHGTEEH